MAGHHTIPLTKDNIIRGLNLLSNALPSENQGIPAHVHVIVVGGACSVVFFGSRPTTDDVDYCPDNDQEHNLNHVDWHTVDRISHAISTCGNDMTDYDESWINADCGGFITGSEDMFVSRTQRQGFSLVTTERVTYWAGDWLFQLSSKLKRIALSLVNRRTPKVNDISDAAHFSKEVYQALRQLLSFDYISSQYPLTEPIICLAFGIVNRYAFARWKETYLQRPPQALLSQQRTSHRLPVRDPDSSDEE